VTEVTSLTAGQEFDAVVILNNNHFVINFPGFFFFSYCGGDETACTKESDFKNMTDCVRFPLQASSLAQIPVKVTSWPNIPGRGVFRITYSVSPGTADGATAYFMCADIDVAAGSGTPEGACEFVAPPEFTQQETVGVPPPPPPGVPPPGDVGTADQVAAGGGNDKLGGVDVAILGGIGLAVVVIVLVVTIVAAVMVKKKRKDNVWY
jgi:hypothetical protein